MNRKFKNLIKNEIIIKINNTFLAFLIPNLWFIE